MCLVFLCSTANFRLQVSRFCRGDLSQFIDLRYVDFGCFSATFPLVFESRYCDRTQQDEAPIRFRNNHDRSSYQ